MLGVGHPPPLPLQVTFYNVHVTPLFIHLNDANLAIVYFQFQNVRRPEIRGHISPEKSSFCFTPSLNCFLLCLLMGLCAMCGLCSQISQTESLRHDISLGTKLLTIQISPGFLPLYGGMQVFPSHFLLVFLCAHAWVG